MTKTTQNILFVLAAMVLFLGMVAAFNFTVDPMCYRCETVDLNRTTQNVYYRSAQTAAANPDAEIIIVGSSRGERVSPKWVSAVTGLKAINLSQGGADLLLKVALVNIALEKSPNIKKVIWMADYFELSPGVTDIKTRLTPVLQKYSGMKEHGLHGGGFLERLQGLIDHRTLEAGLELLGRSSAETFDRAGNGQNIDYNKCLEADFQGPTTADMLDKKISESYSQFGGTWKRAQYPLYWQIFEQHIRLLSSKGIKVIINIAPFHQKVFAKVLKDQPEAAELEKSWTNKIQLLADSSVTVLNFDSGIPGDDGGARYWEDGAHPSCFGVMEMLKVEMQKRTEGQP